jgi:hypothetical protein
MNPSNHATSHYDYFKDLIKGDDASTEAHRKFYDEYNAVLDMDADYYLETIRVVFQDFSLVNGTWDVRTPKARCERVRPQDITTTALFTVEGELDDISGSGQTEAAAWPVHRRAWRWQSEAPGSQGCRALRHLQRPPLARRGVPAGQGLHRLIAIGAIRTCGKAKKGLKKKHAPSWPTWPIIPSTRTLPSWTKNAR